MKSLGLNEIREKYLAFFESKGHLRMKSASLVPHNDNSLLIISSGMAPFKPYFTGQETPPSKRVTTCQKCVRTTDIENVGITSRHGTFFEMLGNFSFGDYFKEEIMPWAWEFLTKELGIPADRLFPSVYTDDDEAYDIWHGKVGIAEDRIFKLGKEDNFWEIGVGPCGPSSEIYFDRGAEFSCGKPGCAVGCDCDRFVEIWNLVFTQFNKNEDGSYSKLQFPNIDTGMGLERVAAAIQGVPSLFDVDTIKAVRDGVCRAAGVGYGNSKRGDMSIRVITDHVRAITFMMSDGILPSNEGRGYVLRRLLRRAVRHGKILGINGAFLTDLSKIAVEVSHGAYPELSDKAEYIYKLISIEESRFQETLDQGIEILKKSIVALKDKLTPELLGEETFKLYDTYGFPPELTMEILRDEGLSVDVDASAFDKEMEKQRARARAARDETNFMGAQNTVFNALPKEGSTEFCGYCSNRVDDALILHIISGDEIVDEAGEGSSVAVITDKTPLYPESGGQKGDGGLIETESGVVEITDCRKIAGGKIIQTGIVVRGTVKTGESASISFDTVKRQNTARNHTATHLLHKALRDVLGTHVEQAGSLVSQDRLRFDFTHFSQTTKEELTKVEDIINAKIFDGLDVKVTETTMDAARNMGAIALFGEKYGDTVRVADIEGYSMELCGGTHVENTSKIGMFKILSESGVAAGVRRIEALTGQGAAAYYRSIERRLEEIAAMVKSAPDNVTKKVEALIIQRNELEKEIERLKNKSAGNLADEIIERKETLNGVSVVTAFIDDTDINGQRIMGDRLRDRLGSGVVLLACRKGDKLTLLASATDDSVAAGVRCGDIVKETAKHFGGSGGGRPNMAQAGIPDGTKPDDILAFAKSLFLKAD